jgi:hypothetical protein
MDDVGLFGEIAKETNSSHVKKLEVLEECGEFIADAAVKDAGKKSSWNGMRNACLERCGHWFPRKVEGQRGSSGHIITHEHGIAHHMAACYNQIGRKT